MKKKHKDYFDIELKPKEILGSLFLSLFIDGGLVLLIYLIYKIFT